MPRQFKIIKNMRKILILILLFLAIDTYSQQKGLGFWNSGFSQNASQYFARYNTKPGGDTLKWYAEFIDSLTANGIWDSLDVACILANNTSANALLDIKGYKNGTGVNSPSFTAYRGYTSNGTTSYINTNYNPSTNGIKLTANSISFGAYSRTDAQTNSIIMGNLGTGPNRYFYIYPRYTNGNCIFTPNSTTDVSFAVSNSLGLFSSNRSSSSSVQLYKNGSQLTSTSSTASTLASNNLYVLCYNENGTPNLFTTRQVAFYFIAKSMSAQQQLNLYNCLQSKVKAIEFAGYTDI